MDRTSGSPIEWRDEYAIGIEDIDAQHRALLKNLTKLEKLVDKRSATVPRKALLDALQELNEYAAYHFLSEESLLTAHLPATAETVRHMAAHRSYWSVIAEFRGRFEMGEAGVAEELLAYLKRWWIGHILETDRKMGRELNRLGIR